MANKSRFLIAEGKIKSFFKDGRKRVYSEEQLEDIFKQKRALWNLPISMTPAKFIERIISSEILHTRTLLFDGFLPNKKRFVTSDVSIFQLAVSLISKSYLSHYSAVFLQGLTTQIPKTIYISFEQSKKKDIDRTLKQESIDSAFSKPQRKAITGTVFEEYTIRIHNGMYSNRAGIYSMNDLPITNIERTLIDITVRPDYAGGVDSVLDIYRNAIERISINKLIVILDNLNFIYPYHQAIGFYLEKAGYDYLKLEGLSNREMLFDFYLTYDMPEKEYNHIWKIYYPKGM